MIEQLSMTFEECAEDPEGKIYADWQDGEFRCLVMRGPASVNAYVGVEEGHPLYGKDYDNMPIYCHGGLTFDKEGDGEAWPSGYWWFGWDYAHSDDYCFYYLKNGWGGGHKWTPAEVKDEISSVVWDFERLTRFLRK